MLRKRQRGRLMQSIGIDMGGTTTRVAFFVGTTRGDVARFPTHARYHDQLRAIADAVNSLGEKHSSIVGAGISVGAQVSSAGDSLAAAVNLPEYVGRPLTHDLQVLLKCPVRLAHDAVCGLLAERRHGVLKPYSRCGYITVSTGTGGAIYLTAGDHHVLQSVEFGHQVLSGNSLQCLCGQAGCLETITGGKQIELRQRVAPSKIQDPVFWAGVTDALAIGLLNLAQLTRIEAVAVGGSIYLDNEIVNQTLSARVGARLRGLPLRIYTSTFGEDAPLVGAATLLENDYESISH